MSDIEFTTHLNGRPVRITVLDPMPTLPARGDAVEAWLKAQRDRHTDGYTRDPQWEALDAALDDYRLHADTGTPLGQHSCAGPHCECPEVAA